MKFLLSSNPLIADMGVIKWGCTPVACIIKADTIVIYDHWHRNFYATNSGVDNYDIIYNAKSINYDTKVL